MAEQVEGSFAFTVLDEENHLYFVKGDNPICLVHFPQSKLYLYASTKEILSKALDKMRLPDETPVEILLNCGDILCIDSAGRRSESAFDASNLIWSWHGRGRVPAPYLGTACFEDPWGPEEGYLEELKSVAELFGFTDEQIDRLLGQGYSTDEIEEALYCCGEL